jgi:topoisomerase-4 subunit B
MSLITLSKKIFEYIAWDMDDEFGKFIGTNIRKQPVMLEHHSLVQQLLEYYMGKNTPERQEFIVANLRFEQDEVQGIAAEA